MLKNYLIAYAGKYLLRTILATCRLRVKGIDRFHALSKKEKCILMLWHNRLAPTSEILNRISPANIYAAFISKSRDGDPLALLANSYKTGKAIRVPHNARHQALKAVIQSLKENSDVIVITPDGPRGPRYVAKPGIVAAAQETGAHVVPFSWTATRFWQLKTWDKMIFPKPFSTILVTFGEPVSLNHLTQEEGTSFLQETLLSLEKKANEETLGTNYSWPC